MAIQVSGTTVIDNSRNIVNAGSVTATSFSGDGSGLTNLPPSGGSHTATASGTLPDGSTVVVNSDGTLSSVSATGSAEELGSQQDFATSTSVIRYYAAASDGNGRVMIVYTDAGLGGIPYAILGTISGTTISFGTAVALDTEDGDYPEAVWQANQSVFVICWRYRGDTPTADARYGKAIAAAISGTTLTLGTGVIFKSGRLDSFQLSITSASSSRVLISYSWLDSPTISIQGYVIAANVSGTTLSFGSEALFSGSNRGYRNGVIWYSAQNQGLVGWYANNTSPSVDQGRIRYINLAGTTITFGPEVTWSNNFAQYYRWTYDSTSQKAVCSVNIGGGNNLYCVVFTLSGNTITAGSPQLIDNGANGAYHRITYSSSADKFVIFGLDSGGFGSLPIYWIGTISGTTPVFGSRQDLSTFSTGSSLALTCGFGEEKVVFAYNLGTAGGNTAGRSKVLNLESFVSNLTSENFIGFSDGAYTNGQTATIQVVGSVADGQSGLTPGLKYYVQRDGSLGTGPTSENVLAGTAVASDKIIIKQ